VRALEVTYARVGVLWLGPTVTSALVYLAASREASDNVWVSLVSLLYATVFLVGGGMRRVFLEPHWKDNGPWLAATAFIIILAVTTGARFVFGPWYRINLMRER